MNDVPVNDVPDVFEHADYPHHEGTLHDCPACEAIMDAESAMAQVRDEYPAFTIEGWLD